MRAWYRFWQISSQTAFAMVFGLRIFGRDNVPLEGPVLLVCNHQSYLDPILCGVGLPRELDYVARESLFHNPSFARFIRSLNAFPIQRGQADLAAIRKIVERLEAGRAIVLFPEATRTPTGHLRPIKSGFELVARKGRATVVPVVVDGAFESWPRDRKLPGPARIGISYGEPIGPEQMRTMRRNELVSEVNRRLRTMQDELRRLMGRSPYEYENAPTRPAAPGQATGPEEHSCR